MTAEQQEREATLPDRVRHVVQRARALGGRGTLLPAMHAVQAELGHVPDEAVAVLAAEFNLSRADVHGVLTFYPDFRRTPGGRVPVTVCLAEACRAVGAERLVADVEERLGARLGTATADGAVQLDEVFCLGNCALGPAALVAGQCLGRLKGVAGAERLAHAVAAVPVASVAVTGEPS